MFRLAAIAIVLCIGGALAGDERCLQKSGRCMADDTSCLGGYQSRLCSGASNRKCCLPASGDSRCSGMNGFCQDDSLPCAGKYQSRMCAGGSSRRCCLPGASSTGGLTNTEALAILQANGMTTSSSGKCMDKNRGTCTSFTDMRRSTLNGLVEFKKKLPSGCPINITGGSEEHSKGPYSHGNGYKVDISGSKHKNTCIYDYITAHFTEINSRTNGDRQWKDASGNIYALESNHWDILYY